MKTDALKTLGPLKKAYAKHADKERAAAMAKYMKERFVYYGIPSPLRKSIDREFLHPWQT
jgi:hypothetical protein